MFGFGRKRKERKLVAGSKKSYSAADTFYQTNLQTTIYAASLDDSYERGSSSHSHSHSSYDSGSSSHDSGSSSSSYSSDSGSSGSWD
ncbi:hypothetical protein [Peribacillus muralis]|uniref:hypothetical protein n=1 Tax=Peribacillus muralis TaxID=264697 RepID=UPI00366CF5F4